MQVRGGPLAVDDHGDGPAFLWGHGLTSSRAREDALGLFGWGEHLPDHRVVRWDARGHGASGPGADDHAYRWPALAQDLLDLADLLGIERFAAGGASMGTATALHAAVAAPERVDALVLAIPPTAWETRVGQVDLYRTGAELIEAEGIDRYLAVAAERPVPEIFAELGEVARSTPDVVEAVLPSVLRGAAASDLPDPEQLRLLTQPALILAWDTDPGHPLSTARALAELLPAAELHVAITLADLPGWAPTVARFLGDPTEPGA